MNVRRSNIILAIVFIDEVDAMHVLAMDVLSVHALVHRPNARARSRARALGRTCANRGNGERDLDTVVAVQVSKRGGVGG